MLKTEAHTPASVPIMPKTTVPIKTAVVCLLLVTYINALPSSSDAIVQEQESGVIQSHAPPIARPQATPPAPKYAVGAIEGIAGKMGTDTGADTPTLRLAMNPSKKQAAATKPVSNQTAVTTCTTVSGTTKAGIMKCQTGHMCMNLVYLHNKTNRKITSAVGSGTSHPAVQMCDFANFCGGTGTAAGQCNRIMSKGREARIYCSNHNIPDCTMPSTVHCKDHTKNAISKETMRDHALQAEKKSNASRRSSMTLLAAVSSLIAAYLA